MYKRRNIIICLSILIAAFISASCESPECTLPIHCDDADPCTDNICVDNACEYVNNTAPCDDLDTCTVGDTCADGICVSGSDPLDADEDTFVSDACGGDDCDDGNADIYPGAPELCDVLDNQCPGDAGYGLTDEGCMYVFVTESLYNGNLGGIAGADGICQAEADAAGISGTYKAWLSDSTSDPDGSFSRSVDPYILVGGTTVANNWDDLTDGDSLSAKINITIGGVQVTGGTVWTNTTISGVSEGANHCGDWLTTSNSGRIGTFTTRYSPQWTAYSFEACSSATGRLYCFAQ